MVAGIFIVGISSLIPCFFGYNMVHHYECFAWIILTIVMLMLWGLGVQAGFDMKSQGLVADMGHNLRANVLSYGRVVFASFAGWGSVVVDYNCCLPSNMPLVKVFLLTWFGIFVPTISVTVLSAALMTITNEAYTSIFAMNGTGRLLSQVLSPCKGGGKFILLLLAFSVMCMLPLYPFFIIEANL